MLDASRGSTRGVGRGHAVMYKVRVVSIPLPMQRFWLLGAPYTLETLREHLNKPVSIAGSRSIRAPNSHERARRAACGVESLPAAHKPRKGSSSQQRGETRDGDNAVGAARRALFAVWLPDERWASRELLSTHHHGARRRRRTTTTVRCRRCFTITYPRDSLTHDNTKKEGPRNYWRRVARLRINRLREHHTTK